jgi:hypothetical protein
LYFLSRRVECVSWRRDSAEERFEIEEESVWRREEVEEVTASSSAGERIVSLPLLLVVEIEGELRCVDLLDACVEMLKNDGRILCRCERREEIWVFYWRC